MHVALRPRGTTMAATGGVARDRSTPSSARHRVAIVVALGVVISLVLALVVMLAVREAFAGRVLPGVSVGSVDVGGLTRDEAATRLRSAYASFSEGTISVRSPTAAISATYADLGRRADVDAMLGQAMAVGRGGTVLDQAVAVVRAATRPVRTDPVVTFDRAALAARFATTTARLSREPRDAWVFTDATRWLLVPSRAGGTADVGPAIAAVETGLLDPATGGRIAVDAGWSARAPTVSTADAEAAIAAATRMAADVAVTDGSRTWTLPAARIRASIRFEHTPGTGYRASVDPGAVRRFVGTLRKAVERAPRNATFLISRGGSVAGVNASRDGRKLDIDTTTRRVVGVILARGGGVPADDPVRLVTAVVKPERSTDDATRIAPLMVRLGRWTTHYQVAAHNGYGANITTPARRLNGTVVEPGATFDFWRALGEVSLRTGYRMGGAIVGGHSVEGKALAGGICAASTTLFNAALRAGYQIVARSPHWYSITRYPLGLDATVSGSQSMRFRNDTPYPLIIRASAAPGVVTFEVWSAPTGRTTTLTKPIVRNVVRGSEGPPQYTSTLKKGVTNRIEWPVDGKDVWVTRTVRNASGAIVHRETFFSHYHAMVGVLQIGTG